MSTPWRCSAASLAGAEPMTATAPSDARWLLVEHPGPWGRKAVAESRLPQAVREHLAAVSEAGVRVQLVRRPGGAPSAGGGAVVVLTADLSGPEPLVRHGVLDDVEALLDLDPQHAVEASGLGVSDEPWWLVCTNGSRDVCCAETGRPVAAALAARWPETTWETTHLGGHRFAGTLLALPSGVALGRVGAGTAVAAATSLLEGRLPEGLVRGRAGLDADAQAAELHLRAERGLDALDAVRVEETLDAADRTHVRLRVGHGADAGRVDVQVETRPGPARRQSCADDLAKPTTLRSCRTLAHDAPGSAR